VQCTRTGPVNEERHKENAGGSIDLCLIGWDAGDGIYFYF
jgi:hypothetical protein